MKKILLCLSIILSVQCFAKQSGTVFSLNEFEAKIENEWKLQSVESENITDDADPIEQINIIYEHVEKDYVLSVIILRFHAHHFVKLKEFEEKNKCWFVNTESDGDFEAEKTQQLKIKEGWLSALNGHPISFDDKLYTIGIPVSQHQLVNGLAKFSVNDHALLIYYIACPTKDKTEVIEDWYPTMKSL